MPTSTQTTTPPFAATEMPASAAEMPKALPAPSIPRQIAEQLSEAWSNIAIVADAQVNIWTMKFVRIVVLAALALPMLAAAVALIVYGFILLDGAFAYALASNFPIWVSPLVRGCIYFGFPMIALASVWFSHVGTADVNESIDANGEKHGEACNAKL